MSSKVDTIVFSKDRAGQLDLFLNSFLTNFPIGRVFIIYAHSNNSFYCGYDKLREMTYGSNHIVWIPQTESIKSELYGVLDKSNDIINLCTDDCVYFRKTTIDAACINNILDTRTLCFSPRLGLNTIVQDYKTGQLQKQLMSNEEEGYAYHPDNILHWLWTKKPALENYGFACHQDSYICRKEDFLAIANFNWQNMRELEGTLALERRHTMYYKPMMAALEHSFCVNIPANNVLPGLYSGDKCHESLEDMNEKFLNGQRLSLTKSDFSNVIGAHQEILLAWE